MSTECILVEIHGRVGVLRLNRPQVLNALDATLRKDLLKAAERCDADEQIGCIVIIGSDKAFAAGADIKEMAEKSYVDVFAMDYTAEYERLTRVRSRSSRRWPDLRSEVVATGNDVRPHRCRR